MARTNPLDLLRTAAREGVHAGVSVGGKALGHAATLARSGLVRGQAAVTAATARRRQPAPPSARPEEPGLDLVEPDVEAPLEPEEAPPAPPQPRRKTSSAPTPAEVAKRAQPRPTARPPAKKPAKKAPAGPGAKLPPRREAEQD